MGVQQELSRSRLRIGAVVALLGVGVASLLFGLPLPPIASGAHFPFARQKHFLPVPVVMVVFDELPAASLMTRQGTIDEELFPNFARLAAKSMWFRNTTTTGVFSKDAMPSILTSTRRDPSVGMTDPHPRNLFTLLGGAYPIEMVTDLSGFCPAERCTTKRGAADLDLGPSFNAFDHSARGADLTEVLGLIEGNDGDPAFYFAHAVLPHSPWRYIPSGQRYAEDEPEPGEIDIPGPGKAWADDPWLVTQVHQRHLLQLALVDRLVGTVIGTLERAGIYDESLLVVTADHGIAFEPGLPKRVITDPIALGWVAHVPLFIKRPHQSSGVTLDRPATVMDILPTVADILELSTIWPDLDGTSLMRRPASVRPRTIAGFALDALGSEVYGAIRTKYRRFGSSDGGLDLFGVGPGDTESWVGHAPGDLQGVTEPAAEATFADLRTLESADPRAPFFPALVQGTVTGISERHPVAIVVNDRVVAMTRTYRQGGETRFYAMVSPGAFGEPPNRVDAVVLKADQAN